MFESVNNITSHVVPSHVSSRFSSNSEAFASELLLNLEEMFPRYYVNSNVLSHTGMLPVAKGLNGINKCMRRIRRCLELSFKAVSSLSC